MFYQSVTMLRYFLLIGFGLGLVVGDDEEVEKLTKFILEKKENARHYRLPTDNSAYKPKNMDVKDFGSFDFVVVGAGAGGSVVANRLSENSKWNVLVLEAGVSGDDFTDIPNMYLPLEQSPYNWGYNSTPQTTSCLGLVDARCTHPRGKGVGGTTLINGLVYSRGHKIDFDKWGAQGNPGWSYNEILPYFKKSENFNPIPPVVGPEDPQYHNKGGYLNVEYHRPLHPQLKSFLAANQEIGYDTVDYNANKIGVSQAQINTKNGRRFDDAKAFIKPVLNQRKNLKVLTKAFVTKILLSKNRASGVLFTYNQQLYKVEATKEVILAAGTYNTAQLLLLSGVGPKKHLNSVGIPVIADLEVGSKMKDHPCYFGLSFSSNLTNDILPFEDYVREYLNGTGPLTAPGGNDGVGFYESSYTKGTGLPDIEFMMIASNASNEFSKASYRLTDSVYNSLWGNINEASSFIIYIVALHSESSGTLRLKSNNPFDYPLINPNLLSDPKGKDINTLHEGIQLAMKLMDTKAFKKINAKLQTKPFEQCSQYKDTLSKDYWMCAIRLLTITLYHPVSSCPMGPKPENGAVVDHNLKVHGFENLRIMDGSVFPFTLSGHPNAAIVMLAEKGCDLIKKEHAS